MFKRFPSFLLFVFSLFPFLSAKSQSASAAGAIIQDLEKLANTAKVLYVAAHPDDENTRLLSYLANQRHYQTAYLSLTRGDGGQNLIGTEQEELLGLIRTQELLAARRVDGAEQFFSRAFDFGYSKNPEETFSIWGKEQILADVVWAIRKFQPDVIITRFPTTGEGGHGHHTASAILAVEAFTAAADAKRFPEQLQYVNIWQAKRLFWNNFMPSRDEKTDVSGMILLDVGTYNAALGESMGEIASRSRSMHKSQGFGAKVNRGEQIEYFTQLAGDKAVSDIFENIQDNWKNTKGAEQLDVLIRQTITNFNAQQPQASIAALKNCFAILDKLPESHLKTEKVRLLEDIILKCAGIYAEFYAPQYNVVTNEKIEATFSFVYRNKINVQFFLPTLNPSKLKGDKTDITFNKIFEKKINVSNQQEVTNPYWLKNPHTEGVFDVKDQLLIGLPESPAQISAALNVDVEGLSIYRRIPLIYKWVDPVKGELKRNVEVIPEITASIEQLTAIVTARDTARVNVTINSNVDTTEGIIKLNLPSFVKSIPEYFPLNLYKKSSKQTLQFKIFQTATREVKPDTSIAINVIFLRNIAKETIPENLQTITRIEYDHIPVQTWTHPATFQLVNVNLQRAVTTIGYIDGAGDQVAACLTNAGYKVEILNQNSIKKGQLAKYDAIIVGIRAFNSNDKMPDYMPVLLDYVENGGTLIEQYNTKNWVSEVKLQPGPYPFEISRDRVTNECAKITILQKDNPAFFFPNKITDADFNNWVQERGLYFPDKLDSRYIPLIACNDNDEPVKTGALIVADYEKGKFVYTGLSFFRQLPAGVPGAYRLLANLIALGKYDGKQ
jgi:LmbE family N-acetylglucosaminyl deacetylase